MIIKVSNCEYDKMDKLQLKSNSFTLYIQCFKKFNTSRDIYEFKTMNSKVYVSSSNVVKILIPDYESVSETSSLEDIIHEAIEDDLSIVKLVFVGY
jgi:putative heme degradation protein